MSGIETLVILGILVLIGVILIMVARALLFFLPATILAGVVWFLTGSEIYTGIAFLVIALLSLTKRK